MKLKLRKGMAFILTIAMLVGMLPVMSFAADDPVSAADGTTDVATTLTPETIEDGNVILSKTAKRTGADTWDVTLTVTPKDKTLKPVASKVILVLDRSGSMETNDKIVALKKVLTEKDGLIDTFAQLNLKVGVITFNQSVKVLNNGDFL